MLVIKKISKSFNDRNNKLKILKNISFSIKKSEIVTIFGKSGIGKTTLLNIAGGLILPDEGSVLINNNKYEYDERQSSTLRIEKIGFVFQNQSLLQEFTAKENLLLPILISGQNIKPYEKKIYDYLKLLKLESLSSKYPSQMSNGECQRLSIIRALINDPDIIIADEPTANLDENNCKLILELFVKLKNELNCSFLIATHDKSFSDISDRIYKIKNLNIERL